MPFSTAGSRYETAIESDSGANWDVFRVKLEVSKVVKVAYE